MAESGQLLEDKLSRREFLEWSLRTGESIAGAVLMPSGLMAQEMKPQKEAKSKVTLFEAVANPEKQQVYIDQIVLGKKPWYVDSVEMASEETLLEIEKKYGFRPKARNYKLNIPLDLNYSGEGINIAPPEQYGKGVKSKILIDDGLFADLLSITPILREFYPTQALVQKLYEDYEIVIKSGILDNDFTLAQYYNEGIPGYPLDSFKDSNDEVNYWLFVRSMELLSASKAYKNIITNPRFDLSPYLQIHVARLKALSNSDFNWMFNNPNIATMGKEFIENLKQDFAPEKLFPNPKERTRL